MSQSKDDNPTVELFYLLAPGAGEVRMVLNGDHCLCRSGYLTGQGCTAVPANLRQGFML